MYCSWTLFKLKNENITPNAMRLWKNLPDAENFINHYY